jgi:hypothetical protein
MSSTAVTPPSQAPPDLTSSTEAPENTFDDNSDVNESGPEWWDDDEKASSTPQKAATAVRITQWPRPQDSAPPGIVPKSANRTNPRKSERRYSVQKPIREKSKGRQRKQNAKAGIKVVTNFSKPQVPTTAPQPVHPPQERQQIGCFVDLAALQALNGEPFPAPGGFWKSRKAKEVVPVANTSTSTIESSAPTSTSRDAGETTTLEGTKSKGLVPSPLNLNDDLSPSDRPIVIGISIPSASLVKHTISPLTASSYTSKISHIYEHGTPTGQNPERPSITVTPAKEGASWSPLGSDGSHPRHTSSVYSQPANNVFGIYQLKDAPPVPQMSASMLESERQRVAAQRSYFSPDSDEGTSWGDGDTKHGGPSRSSITSTCTVFEEDESPVLARTGRPRSISAATKDARHASTSPVATRRSKGWWNYIVTPFLTRSNTVAARGVFEDQQAPVLPSLAVAAAKAAEAERDQKSWGKQFSPITPATSTTINSEPWRDTSAKEVQSRDTGFARLSPTVHRATSTRKPTVGTIPFVPSEVTVGGVGGNAISTEATNGMDSQQNFTILRAVPTTTFSQLDENDRQVSSLPNASNRPVAKYINPFVQPRLSDLNIVSTNDRPTIPPTIPSVREARTAVDPSPPPPPYSPPPVRPRYRAILPPSHPTVPENAQNPQCPISPGLVSPGLQDAMTSGGGIPLSNVPIAPVARRPINLNSGYPELPPRGFTPGNLQKASKRAQKAEARRQRYEKEDAVARKAGGLWSGRGCFSHRGCYGRSHAEGRKRRRTYLGLIAGFISVTILVVVLATTLHKKSKTVVEPSQWLNLTGFPPIYTGLSTVAAPSNTVANTGCVDPATQWSCDLPKEQQAAVAPNQPNQPNFVLQIQWDNSSSANATFANVTGNSNLVTRTLVGNAVSARFFIKHLLLRARQIVSFVPSPAPPSLAEEAFLGNTTDGIVSANKAGEPTPFYVSFLSTTNSSNSSLATRALAIRPRANSSTDPFPNVTSLIPAPSLNSDGTAAPANLLPLPSQQPIRLYDRGLPSEHYGFYNYFDRSIFLESITSLTNSAGGEDPDDENGGATESEAAFRCTWSQTRFLVQMWTRANSTTRLLNSTSSSSLPPGTDFTQPGSFPYPITITTDRHGGDPTLKMIYCYTMNDQRGLVPTSGQINAENRGFGGALINPAPSIFANTSDPSLGGYDGGTGGCSCKWTNFQNVVPS